MSSTAVITDAIIRNISGVLESPRARSIEDIPLYTATATVKAQVIFIYVYAYGTVSAGVFISLMSGPVRQTPSTLMSKPTPNIT